MFRIRRSKHEVAKRGNIQSGINNDSKATDAKNAEGWREENIRRKICTEVPRESARVVVSHKTESRQRVCTFSEHRKSSKPLNHIKKRPKGEKKAKETPKPNITRNRRRLKRPYPRPSPARRALPYSRSSDQGVAT